MNGAMRLHLQQCTISSVNPYHFASWENETIPRTLTPSIVRNGVPKY